MNTETMTQTVIEDIELIDLEEDDGERAEQLETLIDLEED